MKVEFLSGFEKDLSKTRDKKLAKVILDCIHIFENSNNLKDISGIKKLKGHSTHTDIEKVNIGLDSIMKIIP